MDSFDEEDIITEKQAPRRTRSGRATTVGKRGRGRKKAVSVTPPRATRQTRATRQIVEVEEDEDEEEQSAEEEIITETNQAIQQVLNESLDEAESNMSVEDVYFEEPTEENGITLQDEITFQVEEDDDDDDDQVEDEPHSVNESLNDNEIEEVDEEMEQEVEEEPEHEIEEVEEIEQEVEDDIEQEVEEVEEVEEVLVQEVPELSESPPPTIVQSYNRSSLRLKSGEDSQHSPDTDVVEEEAREPDTEMVSEDELPTESKEPLDTEAVSDEELPDPKPTEDLPETEEVSEDELPPEKNYKKKAKLSIKQEIKGEPVESTAVKKTHKRKLEDEDLGSYDPNSPTSENTNSGDDSPATKKAAIEEPKKTLPELEKYWKAVKEDPSDFTGWTYLLQYVDQENDLEAAREAYDAFLSHYPYCYGYWRKYADYEKRKNNKTQCEEVFDRGLKAIPLSVDLWVHYLNYCKAVLGEDETALRTQFERAITACGLEFRSDRLWESYIKWEHEAKRYIQVMALYSRLLATPTQAYLTHFESFTSLVNTNPPQKLLTVDEFLEERREVLQQLKQYEQPKPTAPSGDDVEAPPGEETPEVIDSVRCDEETTALREKIVANLRKVHKATATMVSDRWVYEEGIKRPYFHVKPLERCQLKNWREYLDYEIEQGDTERVIVLFERCLIACALYDDMWHKFLRYLDTLKDREEKIRDVYQRACLIHHTKKPSLHLHWAVFEESHEKYEKASEILINLEKVIPNMIQVAYRRINLERRRGRLDEACTLYEDYINNAKSKVIANNLAIKYARFCCKVKNDVDLAITILDKAIDKDKENPRLYLQRIDTSLQRNPISESDIIGVLDKFLENKDTDAEQKVVFAHRKVEFLEDLGSNVGNVMKAQDEFQRYLKQCKDKKKKLQEENKESSSKKTSASSPSTPAAPLPTSAASQYPANYAQAGYTGQTAQGYQSSQYPPTQQAYGQYNQQYPNQSDPNYANYQNWGYSQSGYAGYNQGWTSNYSYY